MDRAVRALPRGRTPIPFDQLGLTNALRGNRPAHDRFCIRPVGADKELIEVSALPIVGSGGYRGAMVVFWPAEEEVG